MEELTVLRTFSAVTTVLAAALVAANWNARVTVTGFAIFIVASIAWMIDGWLENKASLIIQNVILLLINVLGVWRWFPKAERRLSRKRAASVAKPVVAQQGLADGHRRYADGDRPSQQARDVLRCAVAQLFIIAKQNLPVASS